MPLSGAESAKTLSRKKQTCRQGKGITYIKKHKRLSTKLNDLAKNAERLKKQRLAKAEYRKREREESNNTEIQLLPPSSSSTENSSQLSLSSQSTISSPPSWHRSAKSRSLPKAIRTLPRSPEKKLDTVKSLETNFNLHIQFKNNR